LQYGTKSYPDPPPDYPTPVDKVRIKPYGETIGFMETPNFWMDIIAIAESLVDYAPEVRVESLANLLREEINENLPATVYIPFFAKMTRLFTILNVWEGKVFSTK
jgi:phosphatidylinositol 4-kinase